MPHLHRFHLEAAYLQAEAERRHLHPAPFPAHPVRLASIDAAATRHEVELARPTQSDVIGGALVGSGPGIPPEGVAQRPVTVAALLQVGPFTSDVEDQLGPSLRKARQDHLDVVALTEIEKFGAGAVHDAVDLEVSVQLQTNDPPSAAHRTHFHPGAAREAAAARIDGHVDHVVGRLEARRAGDRLTIVRAQGCLDPAVPPPDVLHLQAQQAAALLLPVQKPREALLLFRRHVETDELAEVDLLFRRRVQLQQKRPEVGAQEPAREVVLVERIAQGIEQDSGLDAEGAPFRAVLPCRVAVGRQPQALGVEVLCRRPSQQRLGGRIAGDHEDRFGEALLEAPAAGEQLELAGFDVVRGLEPHPAAAEEDHFHRPPADGACRNQQTTGEVEGGKAGREAQPGRIEGMRCIEAGGTDLPQHHLWIQSSGICSGALRRGGCDAQAGPAQQRGK